MVVSAFRLFDAHSVYTSHINAVVCDVEPGLKLLLKTTSDDRIKRQVNGALEALSVSNDVKACNDVTVSCSAETLAQSTFTGMNRHDISFNVEHTLLAVKTAADSCTCLYIHLEDFEPEIKFLKHDSYFIATRLLLTAFDLA
jgi:hypothetical protein